MILKRQDIQSNIFRAQKPLDGGKLACFLRLSLKNVNTASTRRQEIARTITTMKYAVHAQSSTLRNTHVDSSIPRLRT